jgi:alpha-mannosidase
VRIALREIEGTPALARFEATLPPTDDACVLGYATRTGAIAYVDGAIAGGFDREHDRIGLDASAKERILRLEVERRSLPTNGLPAGAGLRWSSLLRDAAQTPARFATLDPRAANGVPAGGGAAILWGHSHLDVAWLWPYSQTRRKAVRTFANALELMDVDPGFVFMQSQPQLYEFVREEAPELFERVRARVHQGRFDPDVAALWVESDANLPSGESLLRQMLAAHRYCREQFGIDPAIAWLPDTFGFANTLPTLLAHAGIAYFATTKLQWNDTTRFPYPQFAWRGPDGAEIVGALLASYEGSPDAQRVATARGRNEPVIVGYGDGGGGPTYAQLRQGSAVGHWERPRVWFDDLASRRDALPVHTGDLYLEYHRGTYTTHHDVKAANAQFERALTHIEEQLAWCIAVHAPRDVIERLCTGVDNVWRAVLCNQFHDVLAGAATREAYEEVDALYDRARETLRVVATSVEAMLPRTRGIERSVRASRPVPSGDGVAFDNGIVRARIDRNGALLEISTTSGHSAIAQANLLAAYRDLPKKWDAWNLDAGYERRRVRVQPQGCDVQGDAAAVRLLIGSSPATMRVELREGEPFLRVRCAVDWQQSHTILRIENWLAIDSDDVRYGSPHGTAVRSARDDAPESRARYEVPGQRFAAASDARAGLAFFALDTYGWSARRLREGGLHLGHSLLRSPRWPDPLADCGLMELEWAFAPFDPGVPVGALETAWEQFAFEPRVRLFQSDDPSIVVVACKPAADGDGVVVRVRECDGEARDLRLRCGARSRAVLPVDGLERPIDGSATIEGEVICSRIGAYGLQSFRVRF